MEFIHSEVERFFEEIDASRFYSNSPESITICGESFYLNPWQPNPDEDGVKTIIYNSDRFVDFSDGDGWNPWIIRAYVHIVILPDGDGKKVNLSKSDLCVPNKETKAMRTIY